MSETKASEEAHLIFGIRPLIEAIAANREIDRIYLQKGLSSQVFAELWPHLKASKLNFTYVPQAKLNKLTRKNHQGVVAFVSPIHFSTLEDLVQMAYETGDAPLFMVLDRVTDVGNFGAIIRTAECSGVHGIVIPDKNSAPVSGDAIKTSAGALMRVPIAKTHSLVNSVKYLKDSGVQIVGATEKTDDLMYSVDFSMPTALVMGNEEDGISHALLKLCDARAKIPLRGKIGSLNVSVSAAVVLYEAIRQRNQP